MAVIAQNQQLGTSQQDPNTQTQPSQQQKTGSGFINLQKYLGANEGNRLGSTVVGGVQNATNNLQNNVQQGQQQFQQGLNEAQDQRQQQQDYTQGILNRFQDPNYQGKDIGTGEASGFETLRNEKYQGPTGLGNQQQIQQQTQQGQQLGQFGGSRQGRQELLRQFVGQGNPQYVGQKQALDELLMGTGGQKAVQQASHQAQTVAGGTNEAIQRAQLAGQNEAQNLQALKAQTSTGLQNLQGGINSAIGTQQTTAQQQADTQAANITTFQGLLQQGDAKAASDFGVKNGLMTQEQADQMNALAGYHTTNYDIGSHPIEDISTPTGELGSLYKQGMIDTSRSGVSSAAQQGQLNALAKLTGQTPEQFAQSQTIAGGFNQDLAKNLAQRNLTDIQSHTGQIQSDIAGRQADIGADVNRLMDPNSQWNVAKNATNQLYKGLEGGGLVGHEDQYPQEVQVLKNQVSQLQQQANNINNPQQRQAAISKLDQLAKSQGLSSYQDISKLQNDQAAAQAWAQKQSQYNWLNREDETGRGLIPAQKELSALQAEGPQRQAYIDALNKIISGT